MSIRHWIKEAMHGFLDFVYPIGCRGCGIFGYGYLCDDCLKTVCFIDDPKCKYCSLPLNDERRSFCERCALQFGCYDGGISIALYHDPVGKLIRELKYDRQIGIAEFLAGVMLSRLEKSDSLKKLQCDYIIPVPLSARRHKIRGYNQSVLIAKHLAESLEMDLRDDLLIRTKDTATQIGMGFDARVSNMKDAFSVTDILAIENKSILLVDDVLTTGATIEECAKALKLAGSGKVKFLTVARHILDESKQNEEMI